MRICKHLIKAIIIIAASALIGLGLLLLVYLLPTTPIKENIARGAEILLVQTPNYNYAGDYKSTVIDNFTDSLILNELFYEPQNPLEDAVNVPNYSFPPKEGLYSTMGVLNGDPVSEAEIEIYPRYWHGYVIILKPFFMLFDYTDFKIMNQAVQLGMLLLVVLLMVKQGLIHYLWGFAMMIIYWNPATIGVSIQLSSCFYIAMIASIIVLCKPGFLFCSEKRKSNVFMFFLFLGVLVAYFDFLTYPLVTMAVPYVFYLLLSVRDNNIEEKESVITMVITGIHWAAGYVLMWASKWLLATIITGNNIFMDASAKIAERSSSAFPSEEDLSRIQIVFALLRRCLLKWPYLIMFVITFVVIVYIYRDDIRSTSRRELNVPCLVLLLILGFSPFVWYFVVANHSIIHNGLVCRILGITIFAWYCMAVMIFHGDNADRVKLGGNKQ